MQEMVRHDKNVQKAVTETLESHHPSVHSMVLRDLARDFLGKGYTREELIRSYGQLALSMADEDREAEEEELLEVVADIEGAAPSHLRI